MKLNWHNKASIAHCEIAKQIQRFLFHEGSLTQLIQQSCCGSFNIELIAESWQEPLADEQTLLSLDKLKTSFIRQALLKDDKQALVYARTVIPKQTLTGKNQALTKQGKQSIGHVLFNNTSTFRSEIRYTKIPLGCELHSEATRNLKITSVLWGRQSLIYVEQKPLLITEIFLPGILKYNEC